MKNLISLFVFTGCIFILFSGEIIAQDDMDGHVFTVISFKSTMPQDGSIEELDSLMNEYTSAAVKKNDKILSSKSLRHLYGSDSRELVVINEYASFADIEVAGKMNEELMKKRWPDETEREEFWKRFNHYFTNHSDEIYMEMSNHRK